ncbi:MAG: LysR family transcriptional regulator [Isosphaeraceae bacterium]|nr:LysR family transcriptional regulator [Isosphaeraceae bacterium]
MIEIRQLRHVLALHEHSNFKRAAKSLGISQPALTKSLQRLESELGVTLFDRRSKAVVPTQFGQAVVDRARRVTAEYDAIPAEIDLLAGLHRGELLVGAGPVIADTLISEAVVRLIQRHPRLRIVVHVDDWRSLTDALHKGEISLFVAETSEAVTDPGLEVAPLPSESGFWVARAEHPLVGRTGLTMAELFEYPTISTKLPERILRWLDANKELLGEQRTPVPTVECDDYPLIKRILRTSDCVSYCPRSNVVDELARGELKILEVDGPSFRTNSGIITLRERSLPPAARAFISELRSIVSEVHGSNPSDEPGAVVEHHASPASALQGLPASGTEGEPVATL